MSAPGPASPESALRPQSGTPYKALWMVLLFGWVVSYADRTVTGPVVSWMIANHVGFIGEASNPRALGGLVGSLFFTGYMFTQYREAGSATASVTAR